MSLKSYGEAKGLSPSRLTQLKSTLPIVEFDGISQQFIDLSQIELEAEIKPATDQTMPIREPLYSVTHAQLGQFFQAMVSRLMQQAQQAEHLRQLAEEALASEQTASKMFREQAEHAKSEVSRLEALYTNQKAEIIRQSDRLKELLSGLESQANREDNQRAAEQLQRTEMQEQLSKLSTENKVLQGTIDTLKEVLAANRARRKTKTTARKPKKID